MCNRRYISRVCWSHISSHVCAVCSTAIIPHLHGHLTIAFVTSNKVIEYNAVSVRRYFLNVPGIHTCRHRHLHYTTHRGPCPRLPLACRTNLMIIVRCVNYRSFILFLRKITTESKSLYSLFIFWLLSGQRLMDRLRIGGLASQRIDCLAETFIFDFFLFVLLMHVC